jgi:hypothetical protein
MLEEQKHLSILPPDQEDREDLGPTTCAIIYIYNTVACRPVTW